MLHFAICSGRLTVTALHRKYIRIMCLSWRQRAPCASGCDTVVKNRERERTDSMCNIEAYIHSIFCIHIQQWDCSCNLWEPEEQTEDWREVRWWQQRGGIFWWRRMKLTQELCYHLGDVWFVSVGGLCFLIVFVKNSWSFNKMNASTDQLTACEQHGENVHIVWV